MIILVSFRRREKNNKKGNIIRHNERDIETVMRF